uniref:Uncharacterized protein n=1 Tax=Rhipicephalus microplus TaxID=6941 RepID=A0A6G5A0M8_RHIMP
MSYTVLFLIHLVMTFQYERFVLIYVSVSTLILFRILSVPVLLSCLQYFCPLPLFSDTAPARLAMHGIKVLSDSCERVGKCLPLM